MAGFFVPAGTPKSIVDLLQKEIAKIVHTPEVHAKLMSLGVDPSGISSEAFVTYIKNDVAKWKKVITDAKIKPIGS
jgi:tripartite-type tricarboxylate transporter receptor subunit TctC